MATQLKLRNLRRARGKDFWVVHKSIRVILITTKSVRQLKIWKESYDLVVIDSQYSAAIKRYHSCLISI
ncbi:hypothetical protein V144x_34460 [Gimesia aquarii]|uniref:Uncharacterized protein n=1 Tax=Gimesia aquarii TaxID=2527964 RepID=A0A517VY82_9PLAN|nr:hypothetical protein V144x_34460 [Gimesia aquarii]